MKRIVFDPEKCTGCCACQLACNDQRDIKCALGQKPLRHMERREKNGRILSYSVGCVHCGAWHEGMSRRGHHPERSRICGALGG